MLQAPVKKFDHPRVLLTTFPQEEHGLGLLMAEALFSLNGARCLNLGVRTPISEIARTATAQKADIVALSFSAAMNPTQMASGVQDLRGLLPLAAEIWAGGACAGLQRRPPAELRVLDLWNLPGALQSWRTRHGMPKES